MRITSYFLLMVLLITVVADANTPMPSTPSSTDEILTGKNDRFRAPVGIERGMISTNNVHSKNNPTTSTLLVGDAKTKFRRFDGTRRIFKICPRCFKKLVCPKKCWSINSPDRFGIYHFPGQCIFDCKKCIAYC